MNKGRKIVVCAREGGANTTPFWRILQSKIRNSAAAESEGRQKFLPPTPFLLPARAFRFCARSAQSFGFAQKMFELPHCRPHFGFGFQNAFKIAEKYHAEALCAEATSFNFAECKTWRRGGFEPPIRVKARITH